MIPNRLLLASFVVTTLITNIAAAEESLQPWKENEWYWSYHGKPVLLLGGSDDDNLFQWPREKLLPQLDRLEAAGGNVIRNTMSDRKDGDFELYPFKQLDNGKYDLNQWNDEYWERFEQMLNETAKRNIVVQIEIWDRFDFYDQKGHQRWHIHPYNPRNNVNYSYEESGFAKQYPDHPGANKQPFFFTTPKQRNNLVVLKFQQRFVNKLLDHSLKYGHVLYCMDNETNGEEEWSRYWAQFVKQRASKEGKAVYVTEMWDDWNLAAERHKRTFDHPELYDFVDVSQNNHNKGQKHWDNFLHVRKYLAGQPRPMNTTKTYGATGNKFGHNDQDAVERFWRHLLAGAASVRFHRPDSGLGLNDKAVACIKAARKLEALIPLWSVEPASELLSERDSNEAYVAADKKGAYAVYFPSGGKVKLDLTGTKGKLIVHWINIDTGEFGTQGKITGGGKVNLASPSSDNWVAAIVSP
ncbi:putative collagen-binding domain-containing protein [Thalassoglobus sp.]|uniref:putative collagen-binding domain-containing protein n=1 Tax=Thalassoglobus sp. TaxID=2795869 RepID=UPI003AA840CE